MMGWLDHGVPRMIAVIIATAPAVAVAGPISVVGAPRSIPWPQGRTAYVVAPETGLTLTLEGPANLLFEFRSRNRGKRVIIDILRDERFRSRNPVKLRPVGGSTKGYRFATLLTMQAAAGSQRLVIRAQGADMIVLPTIENKHHREFAVRRFEDIEAPPPELALLAETDAAADTRPGAGGDGATQSPSDTTTGTEGTTRDAEVFGASTPETGAAQEAGDKSEGAGGPLAQPSGVEPPAVSETDETTGIHLAIADDVLSIGGRVYSQFDFVDRRRTALAQSDLNNRNLVDAYFDARPNDDVRGYVQGRLIYTPLRLDDAETMDGTDAKQVKALLDQLWLKANLARRVFVTVGQQPIRWGTGRFWNPTDFVNRNRRDPLALIDERTGVPLLKVHLPLESLGWNLYGIASFDDIAAAADIGGAARAEFVVSTIELALSAAAGRSRPLALGVDVSADFFGFDIHGEIAARRGVATTFWDGDFSPDPDHRRFPADFQRRNDWIVQMVVGADATLAYGGDNRLTLGIEYFQNGAGYDSVDLYPWLILNGAFTPLYLGEQYVGAYAVAPNPLHLSDVTVSLNVLGNLSDGSWLARFDFRTLVMTSMTLNFNANAHLGRRGEFRFGFELPPQSDLDFLPGGSRLRMPLFDIGVGVIINI